MSGFRKGDVVRHTVLGTEKVIVGVGNDRYLCVHVGDLTLEGHLRTNARVAMHRAANLEKVGYREGIAEVDLDDLYKKEMIARHPLAKRLFREEFLINGLFLLAIGFVLLALLTAIDKARQTIEKRFFEKVEQVKSEYRQEIRKEMKKQPR